MGVKARVSTGIKIVAIEADTVAEGSCISYCMSEKRTAI